MEKAITNLGTKELHKQHSVMIEGGQFPRSRVMDQIIFDRYLMDGEIGITQHRAAECLLSMAALGNMWAKGADLSRTYIDTGKGTKDLSCVMPYGNAMRKIRDECGDMHFWMTGLVILRNKDVRKYEMGLSLFVEAMDFFNNSVLGFYRNPLRHLE